MGKKISGICSILWIPLQRTASIHPAQHRTFAVLLKRFKFTHRRLPLFRGHCLDSYSGSKQIFQSCPATPVLQQLFRVCTVWLHRCPSIVLPCLNHRCWGCREGTCAFPVTPFESNPRGAMTLLCKTRKNFKEKCYAKAKYVSLSKHQPERSFLKGRKAVADEPAPVPSPAPSYCKSLRINVMKQFKTAFTSLLSSSIMQFSQDTVILPILLSYGLLSMSPENFFQPSLYSFLPFSSCFF